MDESPIDTRYRSRKLRFAVGAFIVFSLLLVFGYIDQTAYVTLSIVTLCGYGAANLTQKRMESQQ